MYQGAQTLFSSNLISIPFGENFSQRVVDILRDQATSPLDLAQTLVLVPNHRAILSLKNVFLKKAFEKSVLLPKIVSLSDLGNHNPLGIRALDALPKKVDPCKRLGVLSQLILKFPGYESTPLLVPKALKAAHLLGTILDEIQRWGLPIDQMETVVSADYAEHWQLSLEFLKIVTHHWPSILQEDTVIDDEAHTHQALERVSAHWTQHPPAHRVVIAGSLGATPGIAGLIKTVLSLPKGQVFLYGLDSKDDPLPYPLPHPQHALEKLLNFLGKSSSDVCFLSSLSPQRHQLVQTATGNQNLTGTLSPSHWPQMITCSHLQQEAKVIALIMRQAIDTTTGPIVLVTPNQNLGHWVEQELARWNLTANQSDGLKIAKTPPARFMISVANYLQNPTAGGLLSVLKNPFFAKAGNRKVHLETIRLLEIKVMRRSGFEFDTLKESSDFIKNTLNTLRFPHNVGSHLHTFLDHHKALCEKLTGDSSQTCPLWQQSDGMALKDFLDTLKNQAHHFPPVSAQTYAGVFKTLLDQAKNLPNTKGIGSRLSIVGTFESRLSEAEVIILGGLNEDSWPQAPQENPWLNRAMRQQLALPLPEWYIGLAAHDFWSCFYAPQLFLTRSLEDNGTPTLASRWWQRLETVYLKNKSHLAPAPTMPWQEWADQLIVSESIQVLPPAPCPPVAARPKCLYVTEVERLMRDPYAVYAKHCLGLKPLPSLGEESQALKRGQLIHTLLDQYVKGLGGLEPTLQDLLTFAYPFFQKDPISRTFWWQRFQKIGAWVVNELQNAPALQRLSEHKGHTSFSVGPHSVTLKAIADRIDLTQSHIAVIDYKTGGVPSLKELKQGLSPQLGLEAWIAYRQGFSVPNDKPIKAALWHLTGENPAGKSINLEITQEFLNETEKGLYRLFNAFLTEQTPYLACPNPDNAPLYNDYSHLERLKEWQG